MRSDEELLAATRRDARASVRAARRPSPGCSGSPATSSAAARSAGASSRAHGGPGGRHDRRARTHPRGPDARERVRLSARRSGGGGAGADRRRTRIRRHRARAAHVLTLAAALALALLLVPRLAAQDREVEVPIATATATPTATSTSTPKRSRRPLRSSAAPRASRTRRRCGCPRLGAGQVRRIATTPTLKVFLTYGGKRCA